MTSQDPSQTVKQRRSLVYIRLAAYFAGIPSSITRTVLSVDEIEALIGQSLPLGCRSVTWWKNDTKRMHSRAWMAAGWEVVEVDVDPGTIHFERCEQIVLD